MGTNIRYGMVHWKLSKWILIVLTNKYHKRNKRGVALLNPAKGLPGCHLGKLK